MGENSIFQKENSILSRKEMREGGHEIRCSSKIFSPSGSASFCLQTNFQTHWFSDPHLNLPSSSPRLLRPIYPSWRKTWLHAVKENPFSPCDFSQFLVTFTCVKSKERRYVRRHELTFEKEVWKDARNSFHREKDAITFSCTESQWLTHDWKFRRKFRDHRCGPVVFHQPAGSCKEQSLQKTGWYALMKGK